MNNSRFGKVVAVAGVVVLLGAAVLIRQSVFAPTTFTAVFSTATGIYEGDDVRVVGIKVGTIASIEPAGPHTKLTMTVDRDVAVPADARAVIVAPNLVSARYIQLTPAYETTGPTLPDGATIPIERTAVPVEWDEVKRQLMKLATELGPTGDLSNTSVGSFIESAATALGGNGERLRSMLTQLAGVGRILADGSGDVVAVIQNLQVFVTALRDSGAQIVLFQDRLATLSSLLNDNRSALDAALSDLAVAVGDVQRFVAGSRDHASEQVQRLANVTQNLVDHRMDIENILHVAPNGMANGNNIYNPDTGAVSGSFVLNNFSNPIQFICAALGAIENTTAVETAKLCANYLGPALDLLNFNGMPVPINPYLRKSASPDNILYTEPKLVPGGAGSESRAPEDPPAISAYTGRGEVPQPEMPAQAGLPGLLLPAEGAPR